MKDFFRNNGVLILIAAILLALVTAVVSALLGGGANPLANLAGIVTTPIRNGINAVTSWAEERYNDTFEVEQMKEQLEQRGVAVQHYSCDNSAGIIDFPDMKHDLVRAGISTYGMYPSEEVDQEAVKLRPALSLISHVSFVKDVEPGTAISYGGTFVAQEKMKVATIPVGYGDGYPRSLSNKGSVLIHGKRARILGRVCMDQFMVDVTEIPETKFMDRVMLVGSDGDDRISVEELSELSGRFNYEFVCCLGKRIPRVYRQGGEVFELG